jgi:hypothetical protein
MHLHRSTFSRKSGLGRNQQGIQPEGRKVIARRGHEALNQAGMADCQGDRHEGAEGMAHDDRLRDPEGRQRLVDKVGLGARRPEFQARALAVTKTWPVKRNNPIALFSLGADAAQPPVLECHRVAMDQNDGRTLSSAVRIVKTDAVDGQKPAGGWVSLLWPWENAMKQGRNWRCVRIQGKEAMFGAACIFSRTPSCCQRLTRLILSVVHWGFSAHVKQARYCLDDPSAPRLWSDVCQRGMCTGHAGDRR